jgi:Arc/MetJ family transcription regulator
LGQARSQGCTPRLTDILAKLGHGNRHQMMLYFVHWRNTMRTTVALDDELLARAEQLTNVHERSALLREALKALIEREAARRLARLGGTVPDAKAPPRRRP